MGTGGAVPFVVYVDAEISDEARVLVEPVLDVLVADVAQALDCTHGYARQVLLAMLIEQMADAAAYEREATRRGFLPL